MAIVPKDSELASYAEQLYWLFGVDDNLAPANILDATFHTRDGPVQEFSPFSVWAHLMPELGGELEFRQDDQQGQLPRTEHIPKLFDMFVVACRTVLEQPSDSHTDVKLWQVGAFGRSFRPFSHSNTIVFLLVENRLRLQCGLPCNHRCFAKATFDLYYRQVFRNHFGWAFAKEKGAS